MKDLKITVDHQEIKDWVEKYHGWPEIIDSESAGSDKIGIRINFPGPGDDQYLGASKPAKSADWSDFFKVFEEQNLAFEYPEKNYDDQYISWDYKFINRDNLRKGDYSE